MKISAMPAGAGGTPGTDLGNINIGSTSSASRLAAARAIAEGREVEQEEAVLDPTRASNVHKIKMRTNYSTDRDEVLAPEPEVESTISDQSGQTQAAVESTQPLSPQFAALAKQRRALQVKERELAEREAKATKAPEGEFVAKADLLANPLKIFDLGLTYDQLTKALLSNGSGNTLDIKALKDELRKDMDDRLSSQAQTQEEAALNSIADEIESFSKEGEAYELIRERKALPAVLNHIYTHFKKTGQVLDTKSVMDNIENRLLDQQLKYLNIGKVKSKFAPEPQVQAPQSQGNQMKTLTNRDGASIPLSRRARAIAAMTKGR